jgi:DNA polymerase-3 subunit alpha
MRINIEDLDFEDKEVWDMISEGKVKGCFQIEGYLGKSWCQRIKPHNLLELAAVISLIRPGCVAAKVNGKTMTERYADRKDGCEDVVYMHDSIEDILKETYGVIVYQEQSMQIAEKMAGFSLKEADNLRKAIGKKDAKLMGKVRSDFISGCINNGIDEEKAKEVFDIIQESQRYGFNKSHAVGYAQVTYWTAWLKRHYLDKYFKNWLRNSDDKQDTDTERHQLITAAKAEGLEINGPSMKYPFENFIKRDDKLYFGACNVKSVGKAHLEKYINLINDWDGLPTWVEFVVIILPQINKKAVENLIKVGFFSGLGYSRSQMLHDFSCIKQLTKLELSGLSDDIDSTNRDQPLPLLLNSFLNKGLKKDGGHISGANRLVKVQEIVSRLENPGRELSDNPAMYARMEEKLLGCAVSTSELDSCAKASHADSTCLEVSDGKKGKCTVACIIKRGMEHTTKNDETMAFIAIEDNSGELEDIVIFPDVYSQNKDIIFNESTVLLTGEAKISKNRKSFIVDNMFSI